MKRKATLAAIVVFSLMLSLLGTPVLASDREEGQSSGSGVDHGWQFGSGHGWQFVDDTSSQADGHSNVWNNDVHDGLNDHHDIQAEDSNPSTTPPPVTPPPTTPPPVTPPPVIPPPTTPPPVTPPPVTPPPTTPPPTTPPPAPVLTPPAISSVATTVVTTNGATVNGNLAGLGTAASVAISFQYGLTGAYGSVTSTQTATAPGSFSAIVAGLVPNTLYHFRVVATGDGTAYGADQTFTTAAPVLIAPVTTTVAATLVTANGATLNSTLTSMGTAVSVSVSFQYGPTTSYGSFTSGQATTVNGRVVGQFEMPVV